MVDKNSEMSLDDVLSSIKKMIIDDEPPVLDLTDIVKPDGSVVKIKGLDSESSDIGSFLKLVQENTNSDLKNKHLKEEYVSQQLQKAPLVTTDVSSCPISSQSEKKTDESKNSAVSDVLKEIAVPLINQWLNENLSSIINKKIEEDPMVKKWMSDNLPEITKNIVEKTIRELVKKI
ncbi:MAG: DUF2497 domain-containing protein [Holosporaceae bacterium]|jgi:cell pole-organizing protein PopZ|nr:DUF2497 domain-containing protein [Holosporaceae bacterium]